MWLCAKPIITWLHSTRMRTDGNWHWRSVYRCVPCISMIHACTIQIECYAPYTRQKTKKKKKKQPRTRHGTFNNSLIKKWWRWAIIIIHLMNFTLSYINISRSSFRSPSNLVNCTYFNFCYFLLSKPTKAIKNMVRMEVFSFVSNKKNHPS